jgi:hypothetical protein
MRNLSIFLLLVLTSLVITYLSNKYIYTEQYYYHILQENFTAEQTKDFIINKEKVNWLMYVKTPMLLIIKTGLVALLITAGLNIYGYELNFNSVFSISLQWTCYI